VARLRPGIDRGLAAGLWLALPSAALAGPAINQFEMKDLHVEQGDLQFQSQNAFSAGQPRRAVAETAPGTLAYDDNDLAGERYALELEAHLTSFFRTRVGIEFEKSRLDDPPSLATADAYGSLQLSEVSIEGVAVLVPVKRYGVGLGAIAEYNHALSAAEPDTLFFGPIIEAASGKWHGLADLQFVRFFAPVQDGVRDNKWDFAYSLQVKYDWSDRLAFAIEAYGTLDRIFASGVAPASEALLGTHDQHRVGPVIYWSYGLGGQKLAKSLGLVPALDADEAKPGGKGRRKGGDDDGGGDDEPTATLGVGVLAGLNAATPDLTLKWSLEVEF
jgi:hypothetical protein